MEGLLLLNMFLLVVYILIGVAFFTLLERKVLGYVQVRKGPNSVGLMGLLQPFSDAIKLFLKEMIWMQKFNYFPYYLSPCIGLSLMMVMWMVFPLYGGGIDFYLGLLFFIACSGFTVYILFGCGWASNSKYAMLGALRAIAQSISYEVSFILILFSVVLLVGNYDATEYEIYQKYSPFCLLLFPLFVCWLMSCLAESNRSPFDFAEGESELVSGFNVEYSSGSFAFLFLSEYGAIMFISMLSEILYFGFSSGGFMLMWGFVFFFIWMRGSMPRYRYDKLMYLAWSSYLPVSLNYLLFFLGVMVFFCW